MKNPLLYFFGLKTRRLFLILLGSRIFIYGLLTLFSYELLPTYHIVHWLMCLVMSFLVIDVINTIKMEFFGNDDNEIPFLPPPQNYYDAHPELGHLQTFYNKYVVVNGINEPEAHTAADTEYESKRLSLNLPEGATDAEIDERWDTLIKGSDFKVKRVKIRFVLDFSYLPAEDTEPFKKENI